MKLYAIILDKTHSTKKFGLSIYGALIGAPLFGDQRRDTTTIVPPTKEKLKNDLEEASSIMAFDTPEAAQAFVDKSKFETQSGKLGREEHARAIYTIEVADDNLGSAVKEDVTVQNRGADKPNKKIKDVTYYKLDASKITSVQEVKVGRNTQVYEQNTGNERAKLKDDIVNEIAQRVYEKLYYAEISEGKYIYPLASTTLLNKIKKDIQIKLGGIELTDEVIQWVANNREQFIQNLVGTIKPFKEQWKVTKQDYFDVSGLVQHYFKAFAFTQSFDYSDDARNQATSRAANFEIPDYARGNPEEWINHQKSIFGFGRNNRSCTDDATSFINVTSKSMYNAIRDLYIQSLTPSQLLNEMVKLHDENEPSTRFLRAVRNPFKTAFSRIFEQYDDTTSWSDAVSATKDQAKKLMASCTEGDKATLQQVIDFKSAVTKANDNNNSSNSSNNDDDDSPRMEKK